MIRYGAGLAGLVLFASAGLALPAAASSTAASSASDSAATSVGGSSASLRTSSNSSSPGERVAEGDYRVIEVAEVPDRPGMVQATLAAVAVTPPAEATLGLVLPRAAAERGRLAAGQFVTATHRAYGIEFTAGTPRAPFFLVLEDAWMRELPARPVSL